MLRLNENHNISQIKDSFQGAFPFDHVVIDNFLPENLAEKVLEYFPEFSKMEEKTHQSYEKKSAINPTHENFPDELKPIMASLNSAEMLLFLEEISGIQGLIPDPYFLGAGLQQTLSGGKLGIHVDFNWHKQLMLDRRLNVLIYLNKEWEDSWGGHLELWNQNVKKQEKKILPIFNRCVIFATSDISFHGLPDPIDCPIDITRKQINLYFYSNGREDRAKNISPHWTIHKKRPANFYDNVLRPLEKVYLLVTPPIIVRFFRLLKR